MKKIAHSLFFIYQTLIKSVFFVLGVRQSAVCRFHPTCSVYSREVFKKYGFFKGFWLSLRRIVKCHPWNKGGIDLP